MIKTLLSYFLGGLFTTLFGIIGIVVALINRKHVIKLSVRPWGKTVLWAFVAKLNVEGLEHFPKETSIVMYNHQSSFDILTFSAVIPVEWRAVMKKEVKTMPFVGWVSKLAGHYFVSRDGSIDDTKEVKRIVSEIKTGPTLMIAPEGTRSNDGTLLPFKKGAFLIASMAKVPVVPMVIWGGKNIVTKESKIANRGQEIYVKIFKPIDVESLPGGKRGREELESRVRTLMEDTINEQLKNEAA